MSRNPGSFHQLWLEREAAGRRLLELDARLANHTNELERHVIEDLAAPHGKRFLFDDFEGMTEESTSDREAMSAALQVPCWANGQPVISRTLRACVPGCACPCVRCALMRAAARDACAGVNPT
jgi:hypothetical protein